MATPLLRKTIFYSDPHDPRAMQHTLFVDTPFLTFYDKERGFVRRETLLLQAPALHDTDVHVRSCVAETLENAAGTFVTEMIRLPVY